MSQRSVRIIEQAADLEALAPDWWDLWRRSPTATPFTSPAWLIPWWQVFAPGALRTAALWESGQLVGLAPFYLEHGAYGARLLPLGIGISDAFDILLDPEASADAGATLTQALGSHAEDWDRWEFEELPRDATVLRLPVPGAREEVSAQSASPTLDVGGAQDGLAAVPARKRRKLRMAEHRVERGAGTVSPVALEETQPFLADLFRLHGARWTSRGEEGVLADPSVQRFHALALPQLMQAGLARLTRLTFGDEVAGAYYGLQHRERAYAYLGGFSPDFSYMSPGTVLIGRAIAQAAQEGARLFDFLRGQEPYKYEWGAVDHWSSRRSVRRTHDD